ncbi:helix-turn-helix domain-containing protein [Oceanobacillus sp. FSL K6-2867]|uniref:helix-turn-helix domain-containing protein n=1 Tax=Oceanobacillus sp. FSL K6-2867 TaxID=2954748 RepID=UPI0030D72078
MIDIGSFIKLQRTKQEMTLNELSEGIVSVSYLSKIENQKTQASPDIIQLLCNRLGIEIDNSQEELIKEKCNKWYSMLFEVNNKEEIITTYEEIQEMLDKNLSNSLLMFEIHKVRYCLILGNFNEALKKINELSEIANTFDSLQQFYWFKFKGNYYSLKDTDYNQALSMYKTAEEKINKIELSEDQVADLQYTISVTHSKLRNTLESIDYANQALEIFMKQYNFQRCAQCHIILGISYRRIKMHERAIKNYNLAKHLGELNKDKQIIQLTNLNLGYLHSALGETQEAIKFLEEVVNDENVHLEDRLIAITSIIKEFYNIDKIKETKDAIVEAQNILGLAKDDSYSKIYSYIIHTFEYATNGENNQFVSLVKDKFIPFLKKHSDHANLVYYSTMLARHFEEQYKYKDAVKYYKLANSTYDNLISL